VLKAPLFKQLGPGLVTGAADDDPSVIATLIRWHPIRLQHALDDGVDLAPDEGGATS
jgi:hypothetical protein